MSSNRVTGGSTGCQPGAYKTPKRMAGKSGQSPILCTGLVGGARALKYCFAAKQVRGWRPRPFECARSRDRRPQSTFVGGAEGLARARRRADAAREDAYGAHACSPRFAFRFCSRFTAPVFLRKMAFSHAAPSPEYRRFVRLGLFDRCPIRRPRVRAPINMTDQNRASASSVPYRLFVRLIRFVDHTQGLA
jgi:hypothetical protein